jgi:hypothetical protein
VITIQTYARFGFLAEWFLKEICDPFGEEDMERMKRIGDYVHGHTRRF